MTVRKALGEPEANALSKYIETCWADGSRANHHRRDALMIGLLLSGLRSRECLRLRHDDVTPVTGALRPRAGLLADAWTVRVTTIKGGVARTLPVGESWCRGYAAVRRLYDEIRLPSVRDAAWCTRSGRPVAYETLRDATRSITRSAFGLPYTPHCLRHTAAMQMYRTTRDVLAVQQLLGHTSLRWTMIYLRQIVPCHGPGMPAFSRREWGSPLGGYDPDRSLYRDYSMPADSDARPPIPTAETEGA